MINPDKYYSLAEIVQLGQEGYFPIMTKITLLKLIKKGKIVASNVSTTEKPVFAVKGDALNKFIEKNTVKKS